MVTSTLKPLFSVLMVTMPSRTGCDAVAGEGLGEAGDGLFKRKHIGVEGLDGFEDGGDEADVVEAERAVRCERGSARGRNQVREDLLHLLGEESLLGAGGEDVFVSSRVGWLGWRARSPRYCCGTGAAVVHSYARGIPHLSDTGHNSRQVIKWQS